VSIGAPYDSFARDVAAVLAEGASPDRLAEIAANNGVTLG